TKPRYEWAELIGMAILSSPNQELRLDQIYGWISGQFSCYNITESSWKGRIQQSLGRNHAFDSRPKDKHDYWYIRP
ncbi:winged helix DNA-binding domain-containing protein, partial [Zopfia rhizophila CBS 207.26]